jgi:hypothetical protein
MLFATLVALSSLFNNFVYKFKIVWSLFWCVSFCVFTKKYSVVCLIFYSFTWYFMWWNWWNMGAEQRKPKTEKHTILPPLQEQSSWSCVSKLPMSTSFVLQYMLLILRYLSSVQHSSQSIDECKVVKNGV